MNNWKIRRYQNGDEKLITKFINEVFNLNRDIRWWNWLYKINPQGRPIIWLCFDRNKLIGHRAIIPYKVLINGRINIFGQCVDSSVQKEYRRCGIFSKLLNNALENAKELGWKGIFGFPGPLSYPGYLKYGWYSITRVKRYFKTSLFPLIRIPINKKYHLEQTNYIRHDIDYTAIWENSIRPNISCSVIRDSDYIRWRHELSPKKYQQTILYLNNKIIAYCIHNIIRRHGYLFGVIVDFSPINKINYYEFTLIMNKVEKSLGLQSYFITTWKNWQIPEYWYYSRAYISTRWKGTNFIVKPLLGFKEILRTRWLLSLSDTDVY